MNDHTEIDATEAKAVASRKAISDCAQLSYDLILLETTNINGLYKQLLNYLKALTSEASEKFLPEIQRQLDCEFSWLSKGEYVHQLPEKIKQVEERLLLSNKNSAEAMFLQDAKRRLEHISKSAGQKLLEGISQVYTGVHILFDEKLPLDEVREEVSEYLKGQNIHSFLETTVEQHKLSLVRMNASSLVSSLRQLVKLIKPLPVQSELFVKRFMSGMDSDDQYAKDKLQIQFQANKYIVEQLLAKIKEVLGRAREQLAARVFARLTKRLSTITVAKVMQSYAELAKTLSVKSESGRLASLEAEDSIVKKPEIDAQTAERLRQQQTDEEMHRLKQQSEDEAKKRKLKQEADLKRAHEEAQALQQHILYAETLVKNVQLSIKLSRIRSVCATHLKLCYERFNANITYKNNLDALLSDKNELSQCLLQVDKTVHWLGLGLTEEEASHMQTLQKEARREVLDCLEKVEEIINRLSADHCERTEPVIARGWQNILSELILSADEQALTKITDQAIKISKISNAYLKAVLIVHFAAIRHKLSVALIHNMASWPERNVKMDTVQNMMRYFGIVLSEQNVKKILPSKRLANNAAKKSYRETFWYCLYEDCKFWVVCQCENIMSYCDSLSVFQRKK